MKINIKYLIVISIMMTLLFFVETVSFHGFQLEKVEHPYGKLTYADGCYRFLDIDDTHALMSDLLNAEKASLSAEKLHKIDSDVFQLDLYFPYEEKSESGEETLCHSYSILEQDSHYLVIERDDDDHYFLNKRKSNHLSELLSKDFSFDKILF